MSIFRSRTLVLFGILAMACSCAVSGPNKTFAVTGDAGGAAADAAGPLLRFPDIHGETIVFVHGEDIWSVPATGGVARRLTIHDGAERFPRFSPDGSLIAFTGEYDGNGDVYVMDAYGGNIRRVTYHPGYDEVIGWHPTKNKILFRSSRAGGIPRLNRLFLVSPDGRDPEPLIMHEAANGSFSPDGTRIAYNKVARENRTWKRYRGGTAQDIYLYDFTTDALTTLTDFDGTDRIPMWVGNKIYFSSDRDRVLNLYAMDPETKQVQQITHHTEYDVRRPSAGGSRIVYELGGEIWLLDTTTGDTNRVPISVDNDDPEARPVLTSVDDRITGVDISPSGARALIVARGDVFTVPKKNGPTRNLTDDCGSHEKDAVWSPDGKTIAYLSDRSGEYEIYLVDPLGKTEAVRLTEYTDGYRHTLRWSPDSRKIAFADQTLRCYYLDVETRKVTEIDKAEYESVDVSLDLKPISDFAWSPDSRYIAYSKMNSDLLYQVYIYDLETGTSRCVSNGLFYDFGPVFTLDGQYLLFVSNRRFRPTFCDFEWEMVYKNAAGIYALTLRKDGASILPFKSDEEGAEDPDDSAEDNGDHDTKKRRRERKKVEASPTVIDFDGIADRVEALPLEPGNYRALAVNEDNVFYLNGDDGDYNRFEYRSLGPQTLYRFSFEDREEEKVVEGVRGYRLSAEGSHIIYRKRRSVSIMRAGDAKMRGRKPDREGRSDREGKSDTDTLDLSGLKIHLDPRREWRQIFDEAWRMERDFYYEPNMHGIDWPAMREKYGKLLARASCRQDVQYLIGELIGELNTSHTYVYGGDERRQADRINVGLLGTDWERDEAANRFRFKKILRTKGWTRDIRPPLAHQGVDVHEGDYLLRVDGREVTADRNIFSYFQDLAGKQVSILVNDRPTVDGAREYVVKPVSNERGLRYLDWAEHNRRVVEEASGGLIGYVHLPDTYTGSAREFPKYFYGATRKKGIVVDGRSNGGGLDPDIFLQRLDKKLLALWTRRYSHDQTTPFVVTNAHLACLTNRQAGSGGDMLPMEFQMRGMGPVIGTRSWGGLVGMSMSIPLVDGGGLSAPDYRIYTPEGKWIVENEGITPDIPVELHPAEMARGYDAQLMKAVEVLMKEIKDDPRPWPKHPPFPVDR